MIFQKIKKTKTFLPSGFPGEDNPGPGKNKFWGMDSKRNFEKNLKKFPKDWYYRNNDVTYTVNSLGYRAPEFDQVDWRNSIVMFGCSCVFGDGVDDEDTIPSQLSRIVGKPVINMGVGGTGMSFSYHNSLILKEFYPAPLAVVYFWPSFGRTSLYNNDGSIMNLGPWVEGRDLDFVKDWVENGNGKTQSYFLRLSAKNIWEHHSIFYDLSWCDLTADILGCDKTPERSRTPSKEIEFLGRDLQHQGKIPLAIIAEEISKKLVDKGLK